MLGSSTAAVAWATSCLYTKYACSKLRTGTRRALNLCVFLVSRRSSIAAAVVVFPPPSHRQIAAFSPALYKVSMHSKFPRQFGMPYMSMHAPYGSLIIYSLGFGWVDLFEIYCFSRRAGKVLHPEHQPRWVCGSRRQRLRGSSCSSSSVTVFHIFVRVGIAAARARATATTAAVLYCTNL